LNKKKYYEWLKETIYDGDIIELFSNLKSILDLGCGTGFIGKYIKGRTIGIDLDIGALKVAKENEEVLIASGIYLPFKNESFSGVIAKDILEHLLHPLVAVNEIYRVLERGGIVYASVPDANTNKVWDDYTHVRPFTKRSLKSLFEDGGFSVKKIWYISTIPGSGVYMRKTKGRKQPLLFRIIARIGLGRRNVNILAKKEM